MKTKEQVRTEAGETVLSGKEVLTTVEASAYLGVSIRQLNELIKRREIPCYKPTPRLRYFKREELIKWMTGGHQPTEAETAAAASEFLSGPAPARRTAARKTGKEGRNYGID